MRKITAAALSAAALATVLAGSAASASAAPIAQPCSVSVHFTVAASGQESTRVTGQCNGHAPTAGQVARLAAPLVTQPGIRHRDAAWCRNVLGVRRERYGCFEYVGSNTTVVFDSHGRVATS